MLLDHSCRSNSTVLLNLTPSPPPITASATATSLSSSIPLPSSLFLPAHPSVPPSSTPSTTSSSHSASPLVTIINNKGSTPLHFLCYSEEQSAERSAESILFAEAFLQYGSDVNARDNKGVTPILVCCTHGRYVGTLLTFHGYKISSRFRLKENFSKTDVILLFFSLARFRLNRFVCILTMSCLVFLLKIHDVICNCVTQFITTFLRS